MQMVSKVGSASEINKWLTVIANDESKDVQSVSLVNDASDGGAYILAVVLYKS